MAKDPAFLFYPGDYIAGTMYLDFECKGAYMDLLMLQFQKDHMTIHMIKQVLGHKFDHIWSLISDKFQEKDGKYWNERLRVEKENRVNFCKSRKKNRESNPHMKKHMSSHMEDENVNRDERLGNKGKMDDRDRVLGEGEEGGKGEEEAAPNPVMLVPQMHTIWTTTFPTYTANREFDYPALQSIAGFIFKTAGVKNGFGDSENETKVLNTFQLIADQVNREPFWSNKPLASIYKNIQEFYNKIKNPINGTGNKQANKYGSGINDEILKQKLAAKAPRG